jgi:hypothetical protein
MDDTDTLLRGAFAFFSNALTCDAVPLDWGAFSRSPFRSNALIWSDARLSAASDSADICCVGAVDIVKYELVNELTLLLRALIFAIPRPRESSTLSPVQCEFEPT